MSKNYERSAFVTKEHVEQYGYTKGCAGCKSMRDNATWRGPHTNNCRERIMKCLEESDKLKGKWKERSQGSRKNEESSGSTKTSVQEEKKTEVGSHRK